MSICSPSPSTFNATKFAQFNKLMGKTWVVWCNGVQCLVMGELKHIKISNLKSLIVISLLLEEKEVL